jgi:hypothetical protein
MGGSRILERRDHSRRKMGCFGPARIDTGEKGELGYGDFSRKTAIFAARAESAGNIMRVK